MKTYRIIMETEYIVNANTEEEALYIVDDSCIVEMCCESIEELPDTETSKAIERKIANRIEREKE